jgi:hypothetical protein
MRRISSRTTFLYKRVFPVAWFGFFLIFIAGIVLPVWSSGRYPPLPFFIVPVVVFGTIFVVMKKLVFDLVDEVLDAGDALIVRNRGQEERIAFSDIINVNYTPFVSPPRVVLSLRRPSIFGSQVAFCAPIRLVPFSTSPIVDELIQRIDAARRR